MQLAKNKISDKNNWTQSTWSRDIENNIVEDPRNPTACKWCATGSVLSTADCDKPLENQKEHLKVISMLGYVASRIFPEKWYSIEPGYACYKNMVVALNDELGYEAVMTIFQITQDVLEGKRSDLDLDFIKNC